jgi:hypothetical protein
MKKGAGMMMVIIAVVVTAVVVTVMVAAYKKNRVIGIVIVAVVAKKSGGLLGRRLIVVAGQKATAPGVNNNRDWLWSLWRRRPRNSGGLGLYDREHLRRWPKGYSHKVTAVIIVLAKKRWNDDLDRDDCGGGGDGPKKAGVARIIDVAMMMISKSMRSSMIEKEGSMAAKEIILGVVCKKKY